MLRLLTALTLILCSPLSYAENCRTDMARLSEESSALDMQSPLNVKLTAQDLLNESSFAHKISGAVSRHYVKARDFAKRNRGYAVIIATMVTTAAVTTYLTAALPKDLQFLSQFVSQVGTIGIYVFGAPVWEPLASAFRKMAFGFSEGAPQKAESELEQLWRNTQNKYSLNAQMSRNVVNAFIFNAQHIFYAAHKAITEGDEAYAIDQLSMIAVRMHKLFAEIPPDEESVTQAIRASFTRHIPKAHLLYGPLLAQIQVIDPDKRPETLEFYKELLNIWLH
jgi:hypothetical protein